MRSGRGRAVRAVRARPARSSTPASAAIVGVSKNCRMESSAPSVVRMRLTRRVASRECPPSSKKLSSIVTCGSERTSA